MLEFEPQLATDASSTTINTFWDRARKPGGLILRAAFQRNLVWNVEQQGFLVDSILRGLPVPELYVQTKTDADGNETTIVVDGQQRISACLAFIDGTLRLGRGDDYDARWAGKTFDDLDSTLKARFRGFKLIVRNLPVSADETSLREIFRRLNKTVEALEAQELRHAAYTGEFLRLVEQAGAADPLEQLGVFSAKDYLRRRNDEFVAEVFLAVAADAFPNKKEGLDQAFLTYERQGLPEDIRAKLTRRFGRVLLLLTDTSASLRRTRFKNKSDAYSLLVYLAGRAEHLPLQSSDQGLFIQTLRLFSERVNDIKRTQSAGEDLGGLADDRFGSAALTYLSAVERAASDRLNRIRRGEALIAVLDPILFASPQTQLGPSDESWLDDSSTGGENEQDDEDPDTEREIMQAVLLGDRVNDSD